MINSSLLLKREKAKDLCASGLLLPLPLFSSNVSAGFPSPADEYVEDIIDLNKYLIKNPNSTFFFRVKSKAMIGIGIYPGDELIVDRSLEAKSGKIVIAEVNGQLLVRRLQKKDTAIFLLAENKHYTPILINDSESMSTIWGVVTTALHRL